MKYPQPFKERIIALYLSGKPIAQLQSETGISKSTLYKWIKEESSNPSMSTISPKACRKLTTNYQAALDCMQIMQRAINILAYHAVKLKLAEQLYTESPEISIPLLSRALMLPKGTVYNHLFRNKKGKTQAAQKREELRPMVEEIYHESRETYGAGRVAAVLQERGLNVSEKLVARIMHENGWFSIRGGAKVLYQKQEERRANLVQQQFTVRRPDEVWVSDVTYFKLHGKTYYICVVIDLFARRVVGWSMSMKNSTRLTKRTFLQAYRERQPEKGLIFHSDNGSNYISATFRNCLKSLGITQSFSKAGVPYDNSVCESFFHTLKAEELYRINYHSERELRVGITNFMHRYNAERPHSFLNYKTPNYAEELYCKNAKNGTHEQD